MSREKKEAIATLFFMLAIVFSISAVADEVGCCSNPGSGQLACSTDRLALMDKECCPKPEANFPGYYKSQQNPDGPASSSDCATNFFSQNKACASVNACALGCCCSELGGEIKPEAQCRGTGIVFHKGQTNCNQICPVPKCSDGLDNDNNGCADFDGGDLGCTSPADQTESGGSCSSEGAGCSNPSYIPRLSNLEIVPFKGQKKFLLKWKDECGITAVSYDILRCKGSGCTNFAMVGATNTNSFEDISGDLAFDTLYTYQIKSRYNLQTATPTITKTADLGNLECSGVFTAGNFCVHGAYYNQYQNYLSANFPEEFSTNFAAGVANKFQDKFNKAFFCNAYNKLMPEGTSCASAQTCVIDSNMPLCLSKVNCNYNSANPFGLYYTKQDCETGRYCFYDRSHSTVNSCFGCDTSMACYDYKTEDACNTDNCKVGSCKWKGLANQLGIGGCVSTSGYNCMWCESKGTSSLENTRAFNEVFDFCTREKSNTLSEGGFKCYFRNGKSKNCNQAVCKDYDSQQCRNSQIIHDENNRITNPSSDECGIKVCQNINNACVKNADGDNSADCSSAACESDYFTPNTTLLPILKKGIVDRLIIQIYDRTSINSTFMLKSSSDYATFLCVEPCGAQGHPYSAFTPNRILILSNLNVFDGGNGSRLLLLNEGVNTLRYYSQDPARNIGEVKKILIEAHNTTDGPKILEINVTGGSKALDKIFTSRQKPTISVKFFEPAIVTHSRLINKQTGLIVPMQGSNELLPGFSFPIAEALPNGEYTFELNAKNKNNIFMEPQLSQIIVVDNSKPALNITPINGAKINKSDVTIKLEFSKEVDLDSAEINSEDINDYFSTTDNKLFTADLNLSDGNKNLEIAARDYAKNPAEGASLFVVDTNPTIIKLASPRFGTSSKSVFDIVVETDNDAACKFALDNNFEFDFMEPFTASGKTTHTISNFNKIAGGDTLVHKLNVRCKDWRGITFKSFDVSVDTTRPLIKSAFAFPNPVVEKPSATTLTIEADEPVVCKFSNNSREFGNMEDKFEGFDSNDFRTINRQAITLENEGSYLYFTVCRNKAEMNSDTREIPLKIDLAIPISIVSHTPEFFNSTNAVLALETNKKSQCKYSEADITAQNGEIFGAPGYSHTRQLALNPGSHKFFVICKDQFLQRFSDVAQIDFTIDVTPPVILSVNDSSTLADKPEFTWSTDSLRVKWSSIDNESKVSYHLYSLIESGTSRTVLNWTNSILNNEWVIASKPNGTSLGVINGNSYFFRVRAQNIVGLSSNVSESDGIAIDTSLKPLNCTNGVKDERESDTDCGSSCDPCILGKKCAVNGDCKSNFCNSGVCSAPKCDDGIKNQEESDTDCGGVCKKCQDNKACSSSNDCESRYCSFGFCKQQESCFDSILSPGESDTDCGGHCPVKCLDGKACSLNEDCGEGLQCISYSCRRCEDSDENCNGIPDDQEGKSNGKDSDNDGMPDMFEIQNGLDQNNQKDASLDPDNDGLTNLEEFNLVKTYGKSTNPNLADTDGDGFNDKEEADKGTNPTDSKDFPKSKKWKIILITILVIGMVSGFGYLAYRAASRRKEMPLGREEHFELPSQREISRAAPAQLPKQPQQKQMEEKNKLAEAIKIREKQKERERQKIFEAFGKESEPQKISKQEQENIKKGKTVNKKIKKIKTQKPIKKQKFREDAFIKLREITKESKKKKQNQKNGGK